MSRRQTVWLFCLLAPLVATGCRALPTWFNRNHTELPPEAFTDTPTMHDVVYVVNANTDRVHQLQTENATLRVTDAAYPVPPMRANIAFQQPRNFRFQAQLSQFTGRELDLGSNDQLFWFWVQRDEQPSVYFARHDEFASSPARDLVPIEPNRLVDALGLVRFDSSERHSGPRQRENLLEVRSQIPSPRGDLTRVLLLDATYGWMVEQHFYDANGQLLMSARASEHRYYPEDAVTMPHHVEVRLLPGQPTQLAFEIDVSRYAFNRLVADQRERWALPQIEGYPTVDIADPRFRVPVASVPRDPYKSGNLYGAGTYQGRSAVPADPMNRYGPTIPGHNARSVYGEPRTATVPTYRGYR